MAWCKIAALARFAVVLIVGSVVSPFFPDAANAQEVCKTEESAALVEMIAFHRRNGVEGAGIKVLSGKARMRAEWCGDKSNEECASDFKQNAHRYISSLQSNSALTVYARDRVHMCVFLFMPDGSVKYARREVDAKTFDKGVENLRTVGAGKFRSIGAKRLERLRALLPENEHRTPPATREKIRTAPQKLQTPLNEKQITELLFPTEFRDALRDVKHLSIIPFGSITTLPIATLKPVGDDRPVVELFTVNYLLFAGEVAREPLKWAAPTKPLIFGNPVPTERKRAELVTPLPQAEKEASLVKSLFGGTYVSRKHATTRAFQEHAGQADMIYFAAHGMAGVENGITDSFIALADANLTALDIQSYSDFDFKTRLVVMSACQTGLGRIAEFGVIGLARTFLDAGADNAVISLWNVSDDATRELMGEFNRQLMHRPPAEALQIAQQYLRSKTRYKQPAYWAGFGVYGNQMMTVQ